MVAGTSVKMREDRDWVEGVLSSGFGPEWCITHKLSPKLSHLTQLGRQGSAKTVGPQILGQREKGYRVVSQM